MQTPLQKNWEGEGKKDKSFCAKACKYLRNKQVEGAKVFEITKDNIECQRRV